MIDKVPLGQILSLEDDFVQAALLNARYQIDNPGSLWLHSNFPHVMSELEAKTFGWTLLPKIIIRSPQVLKGMVEAYRTNVSYEDDRWVYRRNITSLLDYLESQVYPLLLCMPGATESEVRTDAFAEAFAEDNIESDDGGQAGEEEEN